MTPVGDTSLELLEAHHLLVPTDIAAERGAVKVSAARHASLLKCYRAAIDGADKARVDKAHHERRRLTFTDALNRTWELSVGNPQSLCKPIDSRDRELPGPGRSLVGYQIVEIKPIGTQKPADRSSKR